MVIHKAIFTTKQLEISSIDPASDYNPLLYYLNDAETMQNIPNRKVTYNLVDIESRLALNHDLYHCGIGIYKITHLASQTIIGEIGLFPFKNCTTTIEIGYIVHRHFWKQGLARELMPCLENYIRSLNTYTKIVAQLYAHNNASEKLLLHCCFELIDQIDLGFGVFKKVYVKNILY